MKSVMVQRLEITERNQHTPVNGGKMATEPGSSEGTIPAGGGCRPGPDSRLVQSQVPVWLTEPSLAFSGSLLCDLGQVACPLCVLMFGKENKIDLCVRKTRVHCTVETRKQAGSGGWGMSIWWPV